jgi:hypothetical protein
MKSFAKIMLVGAIAVMAIAISAAPSEAAKKKKVAAATGCSNAGMCASNCTSGTCQVNICGVDSQWHVAILTPVCVEAHCPSKC